MEKKEIGLNDLYELILQFQQETNKRFDQLGAELEEIKRSTNITQEHVARIDERLTMNEKVSKLFDPKVLEKVE